MDSQYKRDMEQINNLLQTSQTTEAEANQYRALAYDRWRERALTHQARCGSQVGRNLRAQAQAQAQQQSAYEQRMRQQAQDFPTYGSGMGDYTDDWGVRRRHHKSIETNEGLRDWVQRQLDVALKLVDDVSKRLAKLEESCQEHERRVDGRVNGEILGMQLDIKKFKNEIIGSPRPVQDFGSVEDLKDRVKSFTLRL